MEQRVLFYYRHLSEIKFVYKVRNDADTERIPEQTKTL